MQIEDVHSAMAYLITKYNLANTERLNELREILAVDSNKAITEFMKDPSVTEDDKHYLMGVLVAEKQKNQ